MKQQIKLTTNKDGTVDCSWIVKLPGSYKINIRYEDKDIPGSPFAAKVTGGEDLVKAHVAKIKCTGDALKEGKINVTNEILVDIKDSDIIGGLR